MRKQKPINNDYYRLMDNSALPTILNKSSRYSSRDSPEKTAQMILKSHHYLYIDMQQQSGCKIMEKQAPQQKEEDVEKIGNSYIWNLKNLSDQNQLALDYLGKLRESQQQKESIRKMLKSELEHSITKLNKRKNLKLNYQQLKQSRKLQFDPLKLRHLVQEGQLDALNQNIWAKQKRLMQKLGIVDNYVTTNKARQKLNPILPSLSRTIQR